MITIRDLLQTECPELPVFDHQLDWGAKASDYTAEIERAFEQQRTPVLIELTLDLTLPTEKIVIVDHHGPLADRPAALEQIFKLLELPHEKWTRHLALVAANDRGYTRAMAELGASREEMEQIRQLDRQAQGITAEQEQQGAEAVQHRRELAQGRLTIVDLPHDRAATVTDVLDERLGGPDFENLLIDGEHSLMFFGIGEMIRNLDEEFPGGWYGGDLSASGFWGHPKPVVGVPEFIEKVLK